MPVFHTHARSNNYYWLILVQYVCIDGGTDVYVCVSGPEGGAIVVDALAGQQLRSRYRWSQRQSDGYAILIVSMFDTQETVVFFVYFPFDLLLFCPKQSSRTEMVGSCCQIIALLL